MPRPELACAIASPMRDKRLVCPKTMSISTFGGAVEPSPSILMPLDSKCSRSFSPAVPEKEMKRAFLSVVTSLIVLMDWFV